MWSSQNRLTKSVITILIVINLIAISTIWILAAMEQPDKSKYKEKRPKSPLSLLTKELELSAEQVDKLDILLKDHFMLIDSLSDDLIHTRENLVAGLSDFTTDSVMVKTLSKNIGELEARIEELRYYHFRDVMDICTPEQKEKFKKIVKHIALRKPLPKINEPKKPQIN